MAACAAYGCKNRPQIKTKGITFHRFPRDVNRRQQWILAVRRADFCPSNASQLCSSHFAEEMFDRSSALMVKLKREAVPTIFKGFPSYMEQALDSLKSKAELKAPNPLSVSQEPFKEISNDTDIQTSLFGGSNKNRVLTVPGDLDILSTFCSNNRNTNDQNRVLIISDDTDIQTMLNSEEVEDSDDNRVIIVSDGKNIQSEWCGNIGEHSFLNGVTTSDDSNIEIKSLNNSVADSSCENPLLSYNSGFYIQRIKQLEEKMVKLKEKLKSLRRTSRRNKRKIIRLTKQVGRINKYSEPCQHCEQPIVHLVACDN